MTDLMLQVADNSNEIDIEGFITFIKSNEDNDLPNDSSGSFMTAIIDLDNILTPFENDLASLAEIDMEEYEVLERKIEEFYAEQRTMFNLSENMEEGTCGYTDTVDGTKLTSPGGTNMRNSSADTQTVFMRDSSGRNPIV